jgi:hypothetical protein
MYSGSRNYLEKEVVGLDVEKYCNKIKGGQTLAASVAIVRSDGSKLINVLVKQDRKQVANNNFVRQLTGFGPETCHLGRDPVAVRQKVRDVLRDRIVVVHSGHDDFASLGLDTTAFDVRDIAETCRRQSDNSVCGLRSLVWYFWNEDIQRARHDAATDAFYTLLIYNEIVKPGGPVNYDMVPSARFFRGVYKKDKPTWQKMKTEDVEMLLFSQIYPSPGAALNMAQSWLPQKAGIGKLFNGYLMRNVKAVPPKYKFVDVGPASLGDCPYTDPTFNGLCGVIFVPYPDTQCISHSCTIESELADRTTLATVTCKKHYLCPRNTAGTIGAKGDVSLGREIFYPNYNDRRTECE